MEFLRLWWPTNGHVRPSTLHKNGPYIYINKYVTWCENHHSVGWFRCYITSTWKGGSPYWHAHDPNRCHLGRRKKSFCWHVVWNQSVNEACNFMINALHDVETTKKRGIYNYTPGYIMSYIRPLALSWTWWSLTTWERKEKKVYRDYH